MERLSKRVMRLLRSAFIRGLATVLPLGLTLYFIYWLSVALEQLLGGAFKLALPDRFYFPGLGLLAGVILLLLVGLAVNAWAVRNLLHLGEALLERIPLVKTVYSAIRDFVDYFSTQEDEEQHQVVLVTLGEMQLIGFMTCEGVPEPLVGANQDAGDADHRVTVYLPMSYQVGGYMLLLPRAAVKPIDLTTEDAMRLVLTAGLAKRNRAVAPPAQVSGGNREGTGKRPPHPA